MFFSNVRPKGKHLVSNTIVGRVDKAEKNVKNFFRVRCFTRLFVGLIQAILAKKQLPNSRKTPWTIQKTVLQGYLGIFTNLGP